MSTFKKKNTAIKESETKTGANQSLIIPEYNKYLEFLNIVGGKRFNEMFFGSTEFISKKMRPDLLNYFEKAKKDGLVYVTEGNESVAQSLSKNELVKVLKDMNLPISGNKIDLVNRIESNGGLSKLLKTKKNSDWIKLTELGKSEIKVYKLIYEKKYENFKFHLYDLFLSNKISEACEYITTFRKSKTLGEPNNYNSTFTKNLIQECKSIKSNKVLDILEVPKEYHNEILSTMCLYFSFGGFYYEERIKEIYPEFKDLLANSKFITIKDLPYIEFEDMVRGYPTKMTRNDNRFYKAF